MRTGNVRPGPTRLRHTRLAIALACALALAPLPARTPVATRTDGGSVREVTNCNDSGPGSLRDAVASALNGDQIVFASNIGCGTVHLDSGPIIITDDAKGRPLTHLTIIGTGYASLTIDGMDLHRVIVQSAGAGALLALSDMTIAHGKSDSSGGCVFAEGDVTLANVEVSNCTAGIVTGDSTTNLGPVRGGGIYSAGSVTTYDCDFYYDRAYGNTEYAYGGAIFAASAILADVTSFVNNSASSVGGAAYGGALAAGDRAGRVQATITLTASSISGNTAESGCSFCGARGGGVWVYGNASMLAGKIRQNTAMSTYGYGTGGGLYAGNHFDGPPVTTKLKVVNVYCNVADAGAGVAAGGNLDVSYSTFDCNMADHDGGAIALIGADLTLRNSTLFNNSAPAGRGGGVFVLGYGNAAIINSTISGNSATAGGGIANTYGSLSVANSTIADNTASVTGGGIYFRYAYYPINLESTIVAANADANGSEDLWPPGMTVTGSHDLVVAAPGVDLPPDTLSGDPMLQPLGANGGYTLTQALGSGSVAIDAGSNPLSLTNDQRGNGFPRVFGTAADIGAYESHLPVADRISLGGFDP